MTNLDIVVVKCGGSTLEALSDDFFISIKKLKEMGKSPVIVHGGGPEIKKLLSVLQVESEFINGLRKTTSEVMDVVEMVLAGKVNKSLVRKLQDTGANAVGLSGVDGGLIKAQPKNFEQLGYVGEVTEVNGSLLVDLLEKGVVPVIAPIGLGQGDDRYNINADTAAGAVALALNAKQLLFVTDVPGILKDDKLIEELSVNEVKELIKDGVIYGGMIPKVEAAMASLCGEIDEVMIVDGKNSTIVQNGNIVGTKIKKTVEVV